jgi:simple sugar transport system substrate-binding protein
MPRASRPAMQSIGVALSTLTALLLLLSACSSSSSTSAHTATSTPRTAPSLKFLMVGGAPASNPVWESIKRGADQAAKNVGVQMTYEAPTTSSSTDISQLMAAGISTQPDGIVVPLPDCAGLSSSVQQAQLVGIPVVAINAGSDCAAKLGAFSYIGQIDYQAGLQGGQKFASAGAKHVICVISDTGNSAYKDRCRGVSDAMKKAGGRVDVVPADLSNASTAEQKLQSLLTADPTIDGAITVDAATADIAILASQHLVRTSTFFLATFDLSSAILQAIQQGGMLFAIDQQPYLQGYLAVVWLSLYKRNVGTVVSPVITTGPAFVTRANVAQVEQSFAAGTH